MISIAIATYNGDKFLREQLESIYNQSLVPDEVVVSDDCSTDNTIAILQEYKEVYGLKFYVNSQNLGFTKNFEKAISMCSGEYVLISDQDDIWLPDKIRTIYNALREKERQYPNHPGLICSHTINIDEMGNELVRTETKEKGWDYLLYGHFTQGCTIIMNRQLINLTLPFPDDIMYDVYIGMVAAMCGFWYNIGLPLVKYRTHANNVMNRIDNKHQWQGVLPYIIGESRFATMRFIENHCGHCFLSYKKPLFDEIKNLRNTFNIFKRLLKVILFKHKPLSIKLRSIVMILSEKISEMIKKHPPKT